MHTHSQNHLRAHSSELAEDRSCRDPLTTDATRRPADELPGLVLLVVAFHVGVLARATVRTNPAQRGMIQRRERWKRHGKVTGKTGKTPATEHLSSHAIRQRAHLRQTLGEVGNVSCNSHIFLCAAGLGATSGKSTEQHVRPRTTSTGCTTTAASPSPMAVPAVSSPWSLRCSTLQTSRRIFVFEVCRCKFR